MKQTQADKFKCRNQYFSVMYGANLISYIYVLYYGISLGMGDINLFKGQLRILINVTSVLYITYKLT